MDGREPGRWRKAYADEQILDILPRTDRRRTDRCAGRRADARTQHRHRPGNFATWPAGLDGHRAAGCGIDPLSPTDGRAGYRRRNQGCCASRRILGAGNTGSKDGRQHEIARAGLVSTTAQCGARQLRTTDERLRRCAGAAVPVGDFHRHRDGGRNKHPHVSGHPVT